jgi:hypothetical protein
MDKCPHEGIARAIAHTLDDAFRKGQVRSQNFKWFTASLLWYFTDRMHAAMNGRECRVVDARAIGPDDADGRKVINLRLERPKTFLFGPGQYVFLSIPKIDNHWHPYSIASAPSEDTIDFFIEVMSASEVDGRDAWTAKLWRLLKTGDAPLVSVLGPYGTGFNDSHDQTEIVAVGSGTGIVPMLSLAKTHAAELTRLNAKQHSDALDDRDASIRDFAETYFQETKTVAGAIAGMFASKPTGRDEDFARAWEHHRSFQDVIVRCQFQFRLKRLRDSQPNATKTFYASQYARNATHELTDSAKICLPITELLAMAFLVSITQNASIATPEMRAFPLWTFLALHVHFAWKWIHSAALGGVVRGRPRRRRRRRLLRVSARDDHHPKQGLVLARDLGVLRDFAVPPRARRERRLASGDARGARLRRAPGALGGRHGNARKVHPRVRHAGG